MKNNLEPPDNKLFQEIAVLIENSKKNVVTTINREMVILYWKVGNIINTDVTRNNRADYGKRVIKELSKQLTMHYGKGFSETNLRNAIKFAQVYPSPQIPHTLCEKLSWSHIRELVYIDDDQIEVAEYKTQIPDRRLFKDTLHHAIIEARKEFGDIVEGEED